MRPSVYSLEDLKISFFGEVPRSIFWLDKPTQGLVKSCNDLRSLIVLHGLEVLWFYLSTVKIKIYFQGWVDLFHEIHIGDIVQKWHKSCVASIVFKYFESYDIFCTNAALRNEDLNDNWIAIWYPRFSLLSVKRSGIWLQRLPWILNISEVMKTSLSGVI